jgi:phytoene synthase
VARSHARTFWGASLLLPAHKRRGAFALYAFCRIADDIVDETPSAGARELAAHRRRIDHAFLGRGADAHTRELGWAVSRFGIPRAPLEELLAGVGRDLEVSRYDTWPELERYCAGVASSVGEMSTHVFGVRDDKLLPTAIGYARSLGLAMQLTNVLRDVGEDARRGRCYLPLEDLAAHGVGIEEVLGGRAPVNSGRWRALMAFQITRARGLYADSQPGLALLAPDARPCARACSDGYAGILGQIERNSYNTISRRATLGWPGRLGILLSSLVGSSVASWGERRRHAVETR